MKKTLALTLAIVSITFISFTEGKDFFKSNTAKPVTEKVMKPAVEKAVAPVKEIDAKVLFEEHAREIYTKSGLEAKGLGYAAFKQALTGYYNMKKNGELEKEILTIADFSKSANNKRFYVVDVNNKKLLYHTLVAHGRNSGNVFAKSFSNEPESYKSSLGFYATDEIYYGKHGKSLRLAGMEAGFNDNAMARAVVIHGADYVSKDFIARIGRLGRSFGCPSLPTAIAGEVIDLIKDGSCLFIYSKDKNYQSNSDYLNPTAAIAQFSKEINGQLATLR